MLKKPRCEPLCFTHNLQGVHSTYRSILAGQLLESTQPDCSRGFISFLVLFLKLYTVHVHVHTFERVSILLLCSHSLVCASGYETKTCQLLLYSRFQRFTTSTLPLDEGFRHCDFAFLSNLTDRVSCCVLSVFDGSTRTKSTDAVLAVKDAMPFSKQCLTLPQFLTRNTSPKAVPYYQPPTPYTIILHSFLSSIAS